MPNRTTVLLDASEDCLSFMVFNDEDPKDAFRVHVEYGGGTVLFFPDVSEAQQEALQEQGWKDQIVAYINDNIFPFSA